MVVLSSEKFLMDGNKTISGRARLFGVQIACTDKSNSSVDFTSTLEDRVIEFRNGSATADILLQFDFQFTGWPTPDNNNPIPGGGIVFDSDMYFDPGNGAAADNVESATFIYQVGKVV